MGKSLPVGPGVIAIQYTFTRNIHMHEINHWRIDSYIHIAYMYGTCTHCHLEVEHTYQVLSYFAQSFDLW